MIDEKAVEDSNVVSLPNVKKEVTKVRATAARDYPSLGEPDMAYPIFLLKEEEGALVPLVQVGSKKYVVLLNWIRLFDASDAIAKDLAQYSTPPKTPLNMTPILQQMIIGSRERWEFFSVLTFTPSSCERRVVVSYEDFVLLTEAWSKEGATIRGRHFSATENRYNFLSDICEEYLDTFGEPDYDEDELERQQYITVSGNNPDYVETVSQFKPVPKNERKYPLTTVSVSKSRPLIIQATQAAQIVTLKQKDKIEEITDDDDDDEDDDEDEDDDITKLEKAIDIYVREINDAKYRLLLPWMTPNEICGLEKRISYLLKSDTLDRVIFWACRVHCSVYAAADRLEISKRRRMNRRLVSAYTIFMEQLNGLEDLKD